MNPGQFVSSIKEISRITRGKDRPQMRGVQDPEMYRQWVGRAEERVPA